MATAGQVVRAILQEIVVQAAEQPLTASETSDTIFAMNTFMTELDANGVKLGYTIIESSADTITIPAGAINGLIKNVALQVAPQFDVNAPQALLAQARKGLKVMTNLGINLVPMQFPNTLPVGSGNERGDFNDQHFFNGVDEDTILTEGGGNILLENPGE